MATAATAPAASPALSTPASRLSSRPTPTHAEYLDLRFDLPEKRYVGCLACQRDPLLSELVATVTRCEKVKPAAAPVSKGKKGKKEQDPAPVADEWEVELSDTVLFPEGGGQPSDVGALLPVDESGSPIEAEAATVREVVRRNLDAVHFVSRPFDIGGKVLARVDMERRTDLMSMHTAQHLLSAVFERDLNLDTLSWSLQKWPEPCYVELPRQPTAEEIKTVQDKCNRVIQENRTVRVRMELATAETGVELNEKAPDDYRDAEGSRAPVQRTVIIDELDENPCCGTHLPGLALLQSLFISPYTTSVRGSNARVYFVSGPRVIEFLSSSHQIARSSALEAGCNPVDLSERVNAMVASLTDLKRKEKRMKEELGSFVADDLWRNALGQARADDAAPLVGLSFREDDATNSLDFLSAISMDLAARYKSLEGDDPSMAERKHLFVLAHGGTAGSPSSTSGAVLILGSEDLVVKAGKLVIEKLGTKVKGGGKGRWQGKVSAKWEAGDREKLERVLQEATA
ncbi:hypothetical protein JCM10212_002442 [Sporobolomyces blumeae]